MACLEKNANRRPQTARDLAVRLLACGDVGEWKEDDAQEWWLRQRERLHLATGEAAANLAGSAQSLSSGPAPPIAL